MSQRFGELLSKRKSGQLTSAEEAELVRLLNVPILDPLDHPPPGFVSVRKFEPSDIPGRLREIDWFSRCGQLFHLELTMPFVQVQGWPEAIAYCRDVVWENAELEAHNQLTLWLRQNDRENFQLWNERVDAFKKSVIEPLTAQWWEPFREDRKLDIGFVHSVQWDILGALMANAYLASGHRSYFDLELLTVYEAGHYPCGWIGEWPEGKLVVY